MATQAAAATEWKKQWGYVVRKTRMVGVLQTDDGRFLLWGKVRGKLRQSVVAAMPERELQAARLAMLAAESEKPQSSTPLFSEYMPLLYKRKVALNELKSAASRERWDDTLTLHLLPAFGRFHVDALTKLDIESWKENKVAKLIAARKYAPSTANGWLSILRVIVRSAVDDYELDRDPTLRVSDFPTAEDPTYTEEEPNSLSLAQSRKFLALLRKNYPQFFAMVLLGFVTGLRPSTLRPLRRRGKLADVLWDKAALLVRRSNSRQQQIMNTTKTEKNYKIGLDAGTMKVLALHVEGLKGARAKSDLLFPSKRGGCMSRSALDKPFDAIALAMGLSFNFTPRGMRRTFQDLGRGAGLEKNVRKAICGHDLDDTSDGYETIRTEESRAAVAKIFKSLRAA